MNQPSAPRRGPRNIAPWQIIRYRLPWAGKASILHRVSGALLFLTLPVLLLLLEDSLWPGSLLFVQSGIGLTLTKLGLLVLAWAYLHHFFAGIRYLLLDLHVGLDKSRSSHSAKGVIFLALAVTAVLGLRLFGVF